MNKKLLSLLCLFFLVSCQAPQKRVSSSRKPITPRPLDKVLTEKHTQTFINKEVPETTEELEATSAVKVTPAVIREYIATYKDIAMVEMQRYNIPASITLAQAILESGSGQGRLARHARNHFGIKCHYGWEGGTIFHDDDAIGECFRKYEHAEASFEDHSQFLVNRSRYASLFQLKQGDYKGWAHGLKKAGYATDPSYAQKLISLIHKYELHQYDEQVLGYAFKEEKPLSPIPNTPPVVVSQKKQPTKVISTKTNGNNTQEKTAPAKAPIVANTNKKETLYVKKDSTTIAPKKDSTTIAPKKDSTSVVPKSDKQQIVKTTPSEDTSSKEPINMEKIKMYIVEKGDTLYGISRRTGISVTQLMSLNKMDNANLSLGQILVIRE
jgi:hypothetical protein